MTDSYDCEMKCSFLHYDEKQSTPSRYIGEGYYVYNCKKYRKRLMCYLYHPLKVDECRKNMPR